jgi:glyoxylase-like metal-dependent hydrolase (beta-lactamase superfamily II)
MKRVGKILGGLLLLLLVSGAAIVLGSFAGLQPIRDGERVGGVEQVKDGLVAAYLVDVGPGAVALVDAGVDKSARRLLAALGRRGLGPGSVTAVLLTHGDYDHVNGALAFPGAQVMALEPDVALAEGRAPHQPRRGPKRTGLKVARTLKDGDVLELGSTRIEVFAVPGHTPGSAAYLAHGVLFLGDSAEIASDGRLVPGKRLFTMDRRQNVASLRALAARLEPRAAEVKAIACAHSGLVAKGLEPLRQGFGAAP